ncbi:acyltransferase domain-containing protein [Streptomyces sp. VRA16 Mangrove soil]|uniref:acyltransferase domain-containing protein n=1 Tax=Streptomyces sp. VRA16 Mangrove soil TaxID=2817434 RepID=UPI001A9DD59E|nr:acyltransferase domain-containing protein [Streptomyces sp. VRA16 Mangrove soil]MBO1332638.1 acyltransferase domain-containing protein [Streptomyces sp. VRA16 Mangrove soil]
MDERRTVLLLPGQGAQRERMAAGLYGREPVFTGAMDDFFRALGAHGEALRAAWLHPAPGSPIGAARQAQPLLFAVGHALGRTVDGWGRGVDVLLGHSAGELAAACLAGVFTPGEAAALWSARARVPAPAGGMLAVAAAADALAAHVRDGVVVGAVNGPRQTVLSGPSGPLAAAERRLRALGVTVRPLRSDHGFHSPSMEPVADAFTAAFGGLGLRAPVRELISCRTARPVMPDEACDPAFWGGQLSRPVWFWPALRALLDAHVEGPGLVLLDASCDHSLSAAARRHPAVRSGAVVVAALLPSRGAGTHADAVALEAARAVHARASVSRAAT